MSDPGRPILARVANAGLVLFGLAIVIILGTGGTRIRLGGASLDMNHLANPLQGFAFAAALRLLAASRRSGLEARVVGFFARQGLAPRDSPACLHSAVSAGALLGLGWGLVCALADVVHFLLTSSSHGLSVRELLPIAGTGLGLGAGFGILAGASLGAAALALVRLVGRHPPRRYEVGRYTLAALWVVSALLVRFSPVAFDPGDRHPLVLLAVAASLIAAIFIVELAIPAAILRARRGRWGVAVAGGGGLALLLGLGAISAFGPASRQGPVSDSQHPNILVVSVPGLRVELLGVYTERFSLTPNIDAVATSGAHFLETMTPATDRVAAAASMLTGLYPASHGAERGASGWRWPAGALTEMLAAHGYQTGAFVGSRELDRNASRFGALFERYHDMTGFRERLMRLAVAQPLASFVPRHRPDIRPAEATVASFEAWIHDLPPGPWFAWVQFADPLRPDPRGEAVLPSVSAAALGASSQIDQPIVVPPTWAPPETGSLPLSLWFSGYDDGVRRVDEAFGTLMQLLATRGEASRTLVAVVSEHGLNVGEDGVWFEAGHALPEGLVHVPWIVSGPGVASEELVPGPTSLVDVAPTLLGLAGLGGGRFYEGEDLSRYIQGTRRAVRSTASGPVFFESSPNPRYDGRRLRGVRLGPWKLVRTPSGSEELYFVAAGVEGRITVLHGRSRRQRQVLSDLLTSRLAEQARLYGRIE